MQAEISLIGSVITGAFTLLGNYFIYVKKTREVSIEAAKREQRQNDRLELIEKKIDEHNGWGRRFESCDKNIALMQKDIEYLKELKCKKEKK